MRTLLRESQRLSVFRHSTDRVTHGCARFRLGAVDGIRLGEVAFLICAANGGFASMRVWCGERNRRGEINMAAISAMCAGARTAQPVPVSGPSEVRS